MKATILFHEIKYWYEEFPEKELTESDEEHITYMINNGYSSGELVSHDNETGQDLYGWWQIKGFETQQD